MPEVEPASDEGQSSEESACWICLQTGARDGMEVVRHCKCKSMFAHPSCLAHWQFTKAGTMEEHRCRLCDSPLQDWRRVANTKAKRKASKEVTLCVQVEGKTKWLKLRVGGPEKIPEFRKRLRSAFNLAEDCRLDIDFTVRNPFSGENVILNGMSKYCAAIHCGALSNGDTDDEADDEAERGRKSTFWKGISGCLPVCKGKRSRTARNRN